MGVFKAHEKSLFDKNCQIKAKDFRQSQRPFFTYRNFYQIYGFFTKMPCVDKSMKQVLQKCPVLKFYIVSDTFNLKGSVEQKKSFNLRYIFATPRTKTD